MYICIQVCVYIYIFTHTRCLGLLQRTFMSCTYSSASTRRYIFIHIYVCIYMSNWIYVYIYAAWCSRSSTCDFHESHTYSSSWKSLMTFRKVVTFMMIHDFHELHLLEREHKAVYIYTYVCVYIFVCIPMVYIYIQHICIYIYIYVCVYIYVCTHSHVMRGCCRALSWAAPTWARAPDCRYAYVYTYMYVYIYIYIYMHIYLCTNMHLNMYTHVYTRAVRGCCRVRWVATISRLLKIIGLFCRISSLL